MFFSSIFSVHPSQYKMENRKKKKKIPTSRLSFWESPGGQETLFYLRMASSSSPSIIPTSPCILSITRNLPIHQLTTKYFSVSLSLIRSMIQIYRIATKGINTMFLHLLATLGAWSIIHTLYVSNLIAQRAPTTDFSRLPIQYSWCNS